jgi:hypothetical protein
MSAGTTPPPATLRCPPPDPAAAAALRAALGGVGYSAETIRAALGADEAGNYTPPLDQIALVEDRLNPGPIGTLVRLFVLGSTVGTGEADEALAPLGVERAIAARLLSAVEGGVAGAVRIAPLDESGVIVIYDRLPEGAEKDEVMAVTPSSRVLEHLTVRRPVKAALDVGTGCGFEALLRSRHAERVVATDINPRAAAFTEFNATLNGATNVDVRIGDLFEPAGKERFDLIVSNPPFVISPDHNLMFRDSGLPGDDVSRSVVQGAAARLSEGGFATLMVNWAHKSDAWDPPLRAWVEGCRCDALLLHFSSYNPTEYALSWNKRPLGNQERLAELVARWTEYYRRLGIEAIAYGAIILRRRISGPNWVRAEHVPAEVDQDSSDQILRMFAAQDLLSELEQPADLLGRVLTFNPRHRLEQQLRCEGGDWGVTRATLILDEGLHFGANIDPPSAQLLAFLDGKRTLSEAALVTAETLGLPETQAFAAASIPVVIRMLQLGLVRAEKA